LAAIQGFVGIARKLINLGANVNAPGARMYGRTALEGAAENGHIDTVRLLLEAEASIEGDGRKQYWRAVRLAEQNAAYATANLLKSIGGWTEFDSMCATKDILEDFGGKEEFVAEITGYFS
jgi:ankyrin repeat protein